MSAELPASTSPARVARPLSTLAVSRGFTLTPLRGRPRCGPLPPQDTDKRLAERHTKPMEGPTTTAVE